MRILPLAALGVALAAAAPARAETKIGYVDMQRALNEIDEGKSAKARLKTEFDQKQKTLNERQAAFEKARADFEKQSSVLSEDARAERREGLERSFGELQTLFQQLQRELSEREREVTRGIFDKMSNIVREIAEADAFYQDRTGMAPSAARAEAVKNSMFPGAALSYLMGSEAIHEARRACARRAGSSFRLKKFHDDLLSYGSIPLPLVRSATRLASGT